MFWWHLVTVLRDRHCHPIFIVPKGHQLFRMRSPPPAPETTSLLSLSVDLPVLYVSCKTDPTICDLWCLTSVT